MLGMFATPVTCTPVPTRPGRSGHCCLHWLARRGSSCHLSPLGAQEQQSSSPFWRLRTGQVPAGWADFSVSSQALNPSWGPYPHDLITPPKAHLPTPSPQGSGLRLWSVSVCVSEGQILSGPQQLLWKMVSVSCEFKLHWPCDPAVPLLKERDIIRTTVPTCSGQLAAESPRPGTRCTQTDTLGILPSDRSQPPVTGQMSPSPGGAG